MRQNGSCLARLFVEPRRFAPRFAAIVVAAARAFFMPRRGGVGAALCGTVDGRDGGG